MTPPALSKTGRIDLASEVIQLVNVQRREAGLAPLVGEDKLRRAAHARALDMARRDFFDHTGWQSAIRRAGFKLTRGCGENIAKGQDTAEEAVSDWMESPGHRENILRPEFRVIGVARVEDIWCQLFGGK